MKPSLFIGCSAESLDVAYALQECLQHDAEVTVWDQGVFAPSKYTLDALSTALEDTDFGVFVFTPDDITSIRKHEQLTVRDNVVFEMGLSIGVLGRERSVVVLPDGMTDFHLPSDLLGITPALFDPNRRDNNLTAALGPAANKIRKTIRRLGFRLPMTVEVERQESQQESVADLPPAPETLIAVKDVEIPATLPADEQETLRQTLKSERARSALWEYRYLNFFLVATTQRVLDWLYNLPEPISYGFFQAYWTTLIPELQERGAILRVLETHFLISCHDLIGITPKGREYVEWRGPLSQG